LQFKGQLLLPNEPGPGLQVNLDVADHHLAVESETGGLGAWPLEVVDVRRLQGDVFAMTVAGEDLHFVADDTISFAYSGLPAIKSISRTKTRSALRTLFDKIWNDPPKKSAPPAEPVQSPTADEEVVLVEDQAPDQLDLRTEIGEAPVDEVPLPEETIAAVLPDEERWPLGPTIDVRDTVPTQEIPSIGVEKGDVDLTAPAQTPQSIENATETSGCPALRSDGLPCESPILTSSGYCHPHDPERNVIEGYVRAQQARARLKRRGTARLNRVYSRLDKAMRQVERGEIEPEIAMAMAQLAHTMCAILDLGDEPSEAGSESTPGR
jgi:hypothetical protein